MPIYMYGNKVPVIGKDSFVHPDAVIIGGVKIGDNCFVGAGAVLRGDYGNIAIDDGTAVEESAMLHIRPNDTLIVGKNVTIGHGAIIHCKKIEDFAVIGLGAILSFDVIVGQWCIVGEGTVVPNSKKLKSETIYLGNPASEISPVKDFHKKRWLYVKELYKTLAKEYFLKLKRI